MTQQTQEVKSKELTFTQVKKEAKENNKTEKFPLNDATHLTYNPIFSYTKLQFMFTCIQQVLPKDDTEITDQVLQNFILFHTIKNFTHLGKQFKATDFSGQLAEMNALIDTEFDGKSLFKLIIDEVFLPEEIKKVFNMLYEALANTELVKRLTEKSLLQLSVLDIENKEILQNLNPDLVN